MNKQRVFSSRILPLAAAACLCGCATVRHPAAYKMGRPEWTFDINQLQASDLPDGFDKSQHYVFLGAESVASATEEAARMGALLNAQVQIKLFMHSHGETVLLHQIRSDKKADEPLRRFRANSEIVRFQSLLDTRADSQVAHAEPIRWYLEEHRPLWRRLWPSPNDTRASSWRAWCVVAVPTPICDQIIDDAIAQYRKTPPPADASASEPVPRTTAPSARAKPTQKPYGARVAESASLGVANLFSAPVEILNQPFVFAARQPDDHEILQLAGFVEGIPVGIVKGALRAVYGAGSLVASPLGVSVPPIVQPRYPSLVDPLGPL